MDSGSVLMAKQRLCIKLMIYQFGFISTLSNDPENVVFAFVRDEQKARKEVEEKLPGRKNLHIMRGDLDDYDSLKANTPSLF